MIQTLSKVIVILFTSICGLLAKPWVASILIIINPIIFEFCAKKRETGIKLLSESLRKFPPSNDNEKYHLQQNWIVTNSIITLTIITAIMPILVKLFENYFDCIIAKIITIFSIIGFISSIMALEHLLILIGIRENYKYKKVLARKAAFFHTVAIYLVFIIFLLLIYSLSPIWWSYLIGIGVFWWFGWWVGVKNLKKFNQKGKKRKEKNGQK